MLTRYEDWPSRLAAFIDGQRARPFVWGQSDCCLFVADAITAMTGVDVAKRWRGAYVDEKSARRVMRNYGGVSGIATTALGQPKPSLFGGRGDVVLIDTPTGEALALHLGNSVVAQAANGLEFFDTRAAKVAWTV